MALFSELTLYDQTHRSIAQLLCSPTRWFGYDSGDRRVVAKLIELGVAETDQTPKGMFIKLLDEPKGRQWIIDNVK